MGRKGEGSGLVQGLRETRARVKGEGEQGFRAEGKARRG